MNKIVQINLNRQIGSNDLLLQLMREVDISVAVISEPNSVPDDPGWAVSTDGLAAVTWRGAARAIDCMAIARGECFCVARLGEVYVCSCYFSPNRATDEFIDWLDGLGAALSPYLGSPVLVLGDFIARALGYQGKC